MLHSKDLSKVVSIRNVYFDTNKHYQNYFWPVVKHLLNIKMGAYGVIKKNWCNKFIILTDKTPLFMCTLEQM